MTKKVPFYGGVKAGCMVSFRMSARNETSAEVDHGQEFLQVHDGIWFREHLDGLDFFW